MGAGRPTKYDPKYCEEVIEYMKEGASLTSFAAHIGVARDTLSQWCVTHEEFSAAVKIGKANCAAWWENIARLNAVSGNGNATLTIFGLKNMAPDDWRDRQEIDLTSSDRSMSPGRSLDDFYADVPAKPEPA